MTAPEIAAGLTARVFASSAAGHPPVVVDHERGEDPGREPGQAGLGEGAAHPLDEAGSDGATASVDMS